MTCRGTDLWVLAGNRSIYRLDQGGKVLCQFDTRSLAGALANMTYLSNRLWVSSSQCGEVDCQSKIYGIEIDTSCTALKAIATDTLILVTSFPIGDLASLGDNLLYIENSGDLNADDLVVLSKQGEFANRVPLPVKGAVATEVDGNKIWLLHKGPKGAPETPIALSEFKLR
jgi:hypothetical protein